MAEENKYPDLGVCSYVAQSIRIIRDIEQGRLTRKRDLEREKSDEKIIKSVKTGGQVYLKHAASLTRLLKENIDVWDPILAPLGEIDDRPLRYIEEYWLLVSTLEKVDHAVHAMRTALDATKVWSAKRREIDRLVWIKQHIQEAWRRTDKICPTANNDDGPIVGFLQVALEEVGDFRSKDAIGRALRRIEASDKRQRTKVLPDTKTKF